MFDLQQKAEVEGRQSESKVWDVLVAQTWTGFAAYCYGSPDLSQVINCSVASIMGTDRHTGSIARVFAIDIAALVQSTITAVCDR